MGPGRLIGLDLGPGDALIIFPVVSFLRKRFVRRHIELQLEFILAWFLERLGVFFEMFKIILLILGIS